MGWEKATGVTAAILLALAAPAMAAQDVGKSQAKVAERAATGTVIAVTPESRTVVVESTLGGKSWILGVEVPEGVTVVTAKGGKKLEEIKTGDRVRLRWIREENRLVAESITVEGRAP